MTKSHPGLVGDPTGFYNPADFSAAAEVGRLKQMLWGAGLPAWQPGADR